MTIVKGICDFIGGLIMLAVIGFFLTVIFVCGSIFLNTAVPMVYGSWLHYREMRAHYEPTAAEVKALRDKFAHVQCPEYNNGSLLTKARLYYSYSWCSEYPEAGK